jgi:ABC-type polysaccharide/polyol phosphate export permease
MLKALYRSPYKVLKILFEHKSLLKRLVINDLKARFLGSVGGVFWNFINPLFLITVYVFVFVFIFRMKVSSESARSISVFYIIAGLMPWFIISESIIKGLNILIQNANIIKKTYFPLEMLPAQVAIVPFVNYGTITILLSLFFSVKHANYINLLFLIYGVINLFFLVFGIVLLVSVLCVYFRDLIQIIQMFINIWIYLTPILYAEAMLPESVRGFVYGNPFYPIISIFQHIIADSKLTNIQIYLSLVWPVIFFTVGAVLFEKLKDELADWI